MSVASYLTEFMLPLQPCLKGRLHLSQLFILSTDKNTHHKLLHNCVNVFVVRLLETESTRESYLTL